MTVQTYSIFDSTVVRNWNHLEQLFLETLPTAGNTLSALFSLFFELRPTHYGARGIKVSAQLLHFHNQVSQTKQTKGQQGTSNVSAFAPL